MLSEFLMCLKLETSKISDTFRYKRNIQKIFLHFSPSAFLQRSSISYFIFSSADTGNDDVCVHGKVFFFSKSNVFVGIWENVFIAVFNQRGGGAGKKSEK